MVLSAIILAHVEGEPLSPIDGGLSRVIVAEARSLWFVLYLQIIDQETVAELQQKKNYPDFRPGDVLELDLVS